MSERTLDSDLDAQSQSSVFAYVIFVSLAFPSGTVRLHNGQGVYSFGGNEYLGVGAYGNIGIMEETIDSIPNPVKVTLSSITDEIITAVTNDNIYDQDATIYVGALNEHQELIGTPTIWLDGYMEKKEMSIGESNGVAITIQDDAAKLKQRSNKRYTLEDHQEEFTGDLFLEFLPYVMDAKINWGGEQVRTGFTNNTGFTGSEQGPNRGPRGRGGRRPGGK